MGFIALVALAFWQPWKPKAPATASPSATPSPADASAVGVAKADKSIAVLPFENRSDDKENTAFFADGMHEDILTHLANIPGRRVISRTSVMEYRGTKKKTPEIARELGVTYLLEGSVHDLRVDAAFTPLRGDPRFEALLKDPKNHAPLF